MITPENLQQVIQMLRESHGNYAEAARVTGVSPAYFSRVSSGNLKPRDIRSDMQEKLARGLTPAQRMSLLPLEDLRVKESSAPYSAGPREEIIQWVEGLSPEQFAALRTIMDLIPGRTGRKPGSRSKPSRSVQKKPDV